MDKFLFRLLKKYGRDFNWPPYPKDFMLPFWTKRKLWYLKDFYMGHNREFAKIPLLEMSEEEFGFEIGDMFNAVLIKPRKTTGFKGKYRVRQFIFPPNKMGGWVECEDSLSGFGTLKKGELIASVPYRLEIIGRNEDEFKCVALRGVFDKENLYWNFTHCDYEKRIKRADNLSKR